MPPVSPLSVLNVGYPLSPVTPDAVGGAEQILSYLDTALVARGDTSHVVAAEGSLVRGELTPIRDVSGDGRKQVLFSDEHFRHAVQRSCAAAVSSVLARSTVDLIHLHGVDFLGYLPDVDRPTVVTLHLPPSWYPREALSLQGTVRLVFVSERQRAAAPPAHQDGVVIPNGVDVERFKPRGAKADFALALGRICPEKGLDVAVRACRRAAVPLLVGGAVFRYGAHQRYFDEVLSPLFDDDRRFVGAIGGEQKQALLAAARCVLIPSQVDETSSLVAMEALASGTPVVASRRGALVDIVEDGRTGFLVTSEDEVVDALRDVGRLRPEDCRAAAETRFSSGTMTERYFGLYRLLTTSSTGTRRPPKRFGRSGQTPLTLDELRTAEQLDAIAPEWTALCDECPDGTPFQRPEWLLSWERHLSFGGEPRVITFRRNGRLVGLLPLELRHQPGGSRVLSLLGAGVTDHLDMLVLPGVSLELPLLAHLHQTRRQWDALELEALRPSSPLLALRFPEDWADEVAGGIASPVLRLPPPSTPANLRRAGARLGRLPKARWLRANPSNVDDLLEAFIELHGQRWSGVGERGVLVDPAVLAFHRSAAPQLVARNILRLHVLEVAGQPAAAIYALLEKQRLFCYLQGFNPELRRVSPGLLVVAHAIEAAAAEGATVVDLLRGREPYKYGWGATDVPSFVRRIGSSGAAERQLVLRGAGAVLGTAGDPQGAVC